MARDSGASSESRCVLRGGIRAAPFSVFDFNAGTGKSAHRGTPTHIPDRLHTRTFMRVCDAGVCGG
jgi:hypothetical protein